MSNYKKVSGIYKFQNKLNERTNLPLTKIINSQLLSEKFTKNNNSF